MNATTTKRPGLLVLTSKGKKGRTYNDEELINGKIRVHLLNKDFSPNGKKILCSPDSIQVRGNFD